MMHRRELLNTAVTVGSVSLLSRTSSLRADDDPSPPRIIDTNVSLFQWPFRRLPLDATLPLVEKLRVLSIKQAWAGSFEGILHRDVTSVNDRLAQACNNYEELVPIGSINPELPDWRSDLEICVSKHQMPGVRIHPNYHGYQLDDPRCVQLIQQATLAGKFVQIAAKVEDRRTQHPLVQVADVDLTPLPSVLKKCPGAKVQILNDRPNGQLLDQLANTDGVFFDISRVDGTDGISKLMHSVPNDRVLFGSHAPFLIHEAALIRVDESDLGPEQRNLLMSANAKSLVNQSGESRVDRS